MHHLPFSCLCYFIGCGDFIPQDCAGIEDFFDCRPHCRKAAGAVRLQPKAGYVSAYLQCDVRLSCKITTNNNAACDFSEVVIFGTGATIQPLRRDIVEHFHAHKINIDIMDTVSFYVLYFHQKKKFHIILFICCTCVTLT